jgi:hypothetical protein
MSRNSCVAVCLRFLSRLLCGEGGELNRLGVPPCHVCLFFSFVLSPIVRSFVKLLFVFGRFVFARSDESWMLMLLVGCVSFFGVFLVVLQKEEVEEVIFRREEELVESKASSRGLVLNWQSK